MKIERGGSADLPAVVELLDGAVAWLVDIGATGQWGTTGWSASPRRLAALEEKLRTDTLWLAIGDQEAGGPPIGAMTLSRQPIAYIDPVDEPEVYVTLLVTSRHHRGAGIGSALLDHARTRTRELGAGLLRVDCYRGEDGRLVDYYRRNGFAPARPFHVGDWPG
ncbi:MAG: GNAT family N-acetyltransferase [Saccharothrix sp.]|nr:GNAT family N-acetyltransferase [Saccharothrix sp.]